MNADNRLNRRQFLAAGGKAATLTLSMASLGGAVSTAFVKQAVAGTAPVGYAAWEDIYRREWHWDKVAWGSHLNICWPQGSCSFHVFTRNGIVWREEQAAHTVACNPNYVDYNPLGCQKGSAFSNNLYGDDRVLYPLKRAGERGEGKWQRVSWDQALTEVADSILDSYISQGGGDGFILDAPHVHAGSAAWAGGFRMNALLDGVSPDINVDIGDTYAGAWTTFGKMHCGFSADNLLDAELIFMTFTNWSYTYPTGYHFMTEARYKGAEIVVIAPDMSPSSPACDVHVPVRVGTDAAFWLAVSHELVEQGLIDRAFVTEQTDFPLLVRSDNRKFLTAVDVTGTGRADQFYFFDETAKAIAPASRKTLKIAGSPALAGTYHVTLKDGSDVTVRTVFDLIKERLAEYTPEKAHEMCGVHPSLIRELAKKVATKRTLNYIGFSSAKSYHGDLMERALFLAMALSGNWGKSGTGFFTWSYPEDQMFFLGVMEKPTAQGGMDDFFKLEKGIQEQILKDDPDASDEFANIELTKLITRKMGVVPPAYWLYHHAGYDKLWDRNEWADPIYKKTFGDYFREAVDKGWWAKDHMRPAPDKTPQVLWLISQNPLRRKRAGAIQYPQVLFPKLKMIFAMETRMSSSAMFADIILPCAWYYEKVEMTTPCTGNPFFAFVDAAVKPAGECKPEWDIMALLMKKIVDRAAARNMVDFTDHEGNKRKFSELYDRFTMHGQITTNEDCIREMVAVNCATGIFPKDYSYDQFKKDGHRKFESLGIGISSSSAGSTYHSDKPFTTFRWHVEDKKIYPTQARRAQFYIDHEWYIDADEALPRHKPTPMTGGKHPFQITGGHPRVSVHATHLTNSFFMRLHRGQPVLHMNDQDAAELGIKDGDKVILYNDFAESEMMAKPAANVQPKQVIAYFWDAHQFKGWKPYDSVLIGIPKAIQWAGNYEQLRYYWMVGSPAPVTDRGVRVSVRKA